MNPFILIQEPKPELIITPSRYHEWREAADVGGIIVWGREGMVRVVSTDVLDNALRIFNDYTLMVSCGRLAVMPMSAKLILWEQASVVDE